MKLSDYIEKYYGGNKAAFARVMGVQRSDPALWIKAGWIYHDGKLYGPRREVPLPPVQEGV